MIHYRRSAGELDELSYTLCGGSVREKTCTVSEAEVTCEVCRGVLSGKSLLEWIDCSVVGGIPVYELLELTVKKCGVVASVAQHRAGEWIAYLNNSSLVFSGQNALEEAKDYVMRALRRAV